MGGIKKMIPEVCYGLAGCAVLFMLFSFHIRETLPAVLAGLFFAAATYGSLSLEIYAATSGELGHVTVQPAYYITALFGFMALLSLVYAGYTAMSDIRDETELLESC